MEIEIEKGIDYGDGSGLRRCENETTCNQEWLPGWRCRDNTETLSTVHPAVQPQRQQRLTTQLRYPIGIPTPFETNYSRGHLIHSRSPPDEIRFYWLREKSLSRSCIKSTERSTLNIWHGKKRKHYIRANAITPPEEECFVWQWLVSCPINNGNDSIRGGVMGCNSKSCQTRVTRSS